MDLLLDTHALIWFINGSEELPSKSIGLIKNIRNRCFISIASIWEIGIKLSLKKLELNCEFEELAEILDNNDIEILPISFEHIQKLLELEFHHRDPFDRIIIAQSLYEEIPIISKDRFFENYNTTIFWE